MTTASIPQILVPMFYSYAANPAASTTPILPTAFLQPQIEENNELNPGPQIGDNEGHVREYVAPNIELYNGSKSVPLFQELLLNGNSAIIEGASTAASTANTTQFFTLGGWSKPLNTESQEQILLRTPGTLIFFFLSISANSVNASTVFTLRQNGANTNIAITVGSATTGIFEETVTSIAVNPGDKFNIQGAPGGGSTGTYTVRMSAVTFIASDGSKTVTREVNAGVNATVTAASQTAYLPLAGDLNSSTTETDVQCIQQTDGTFTNFAVNIASNTNTNAVTYKFRKNAADGNSNLTVGAGLTGYFEDTTNSDTVSRNDLCDIAFTTGAATVSFLPTGVMIDYVNTNYGTQLVSARPAGAGYANALTHYLNLAGPVGFTGPSETFVKTTARLSTPQYYFTRLSINIISNTVGASSTLTFRKNAAGGNQTISIAANQAGILSDMTDSDTVVNGDTVDMQIVTGAGTSQTLTIGVISLWASTRVLPKNVIATLSETITVGDSIARLAAKTRTVSQTVTVSDSLTRMTAKSRSINQTVTVSDSIARVKGAVKALSQTVTVSDALARVKGSIRTLSQTVTVSDSLTRLAAKTRTIAQTITVSDALTRIAGKSRALATQSITVSDAVARVKGAVKSLSQTVTVGDSLSRMAAKTRAINQSVTVSDSLTRVAAKSRALATQTINVSDAVAKVKGAVKTISQTVTVSDSLTRVAAKTRTLSQSITVSDSLTKIAGKIRALAESISVSDSVSQQKTSGQQNITRTITETAISVADALDRIAGKNRSVSDTITVSDSTSRSKGTSRSLNETVTVSAGAITRLKTTVRAITEAAIVITEALDYVVEHVPFVPGEGGGGGPLSGVRRTLQEELRRRKELERLPKIVERQLYEKITVKDDLKLKVTKSAQSFDAMIKVILEPIKPVEASISVTLKQEKPRIRPLEELSRVVRQMSKGELEIVADPKQEPQQKRPTTSLSPVPNYSQDQQSSQHKVIEIDNKKQRLKSKKLAKIVTVMKLKQLFDILMSGEI